MTIPLITGPQDVAGLQGAINGLINQINQSDALAVYSPALSRALDPKKFDHIGDSRAAQIKTANATTPTIDNTSSVHWFNQANALLGNRMRWGLDLGISGNRSDQYINTNLNQALVTNAGWLCFNMPAVNDLAQSTAGYTDTNGVVVTASNVAQVCAANIIAAANQALAIGKKVLLTLEPGATTLTAANVAQMHELNLRLRAYAEATPGVYVWSANSVLWSAAGSATLVVFKTGMSTDGTHYTTLGGYTAGKAFVTYIQNLVPYSDLAPATINDVQTTNPLQLIPNALFNTLTGGAASGGLVLTSGTIPASLDVNGSANMSVIMTNGANANGFGNDVTFAFTAAAAGLVRITWTAPSNTLWQLTDILEGGLDVDVAIGSSKAAIYWQTTISTDVGANDCWSLYAGGTNGDGPTEAYSYRLRSPPGQAKAGSVTKSFLTLRLNINFTAAGNATLTLRRPTTERRIF